MDIVETALPNRSEEKPGGEASPPYSYNGLDKLLIILQLLNPLHRNGAMLQYTLTRTHTRRLLHHEKRAQCGPQRHHKIKMIAHMCFGRKSFYGLIKHR